VAVHKEHRDLVEADYKLFDGLHEAAVCTWLQCCCCCCCCTVLTAVPAAAVQVIVHMLTLLYSLVRPLVSTPPMLLHAVSV
jgi:hypothetical protein